MTRIILIGNDGSLSKSLLHELCLTQNCIFVTSNEFLLKPDVIKDVGEIIYIGGETRNPDLMMLHNFEIPKLIFEKSKSLNIKFSYLSSLSVFGNIYSDVITVNSNRNPIDLYGKSKLLFDEYVINSGYKNFLAFMPASLHSNKGRSSVEKFDKLTGKHSLFKYLGFRGSLSYYFVSDLIKDIVVSKDTYGFKILSNQYSLAKNQLFLIPKFPLFFFKIFEIFLGSDKTLKLRMLIRGIEYK